MENSSRKCHLKIIKKIRSNDSNRIDNQYSTAQESRIICFPFRIKTLTLQLKEMKSMEKLKDIRAIAFDADDTLWALQNYFEDVEHEYCELLSAYGKEKEISAALFETESRNMADLGYGCKAFTLSLVENAIRVSLGKVEANVIAQIPNRWRVLRLLLPASVK